MTFETLDMLVDILDETLRSDQRYALNLIFSIYGYNEDSLDGFIYTLFGYHIYNYPDFEGLV